ncbi:MAG: VanW family protein [Acidimicrobiia bacterium]
MARHRGATNGWLWVLPSLAIPLVISAAAWTTHVSSEGIAIAPNVSFAEIDVSGLAPELAAAHVGWRELAFLETPLTIDLGERQVTMSARELGYDYLYGDTVSAVISARHSERVWEEFLGWVSTPLEEVVVADRFVLDEDTARDRLSADDLVVEPPVEPQVTNGDGSEMEVTPGVDGVGMDVVQMIAVLAAAPIESGPVEVPAVLVPIPPSVSDGDAATVAAKVNEKTQQGLVAAVDATAARIRAGRVRDHLRSQVVDGVMTMSFDVEGLQEEIESMFPEPVGEFQPPQLEVVDGVVRLVAEGRPPPVCCSTESVESAARNFLNGDAPLYRLETRPNHDETMIAWADGSQVTEVVGDFTTNHACCENRVSNIHTIADTLTGVYLIPGERLSLNEFVGPRTREKGYLPAGAIRGGHLTDEVGGGVSQFVTTMFNAAYFAGLELDQYQSHSVYFSRYPFGREATLSMPGPDLVITNTTDYPVLIWPTYDATSITVTLYSTKHIEVEELDQRTSRRGQCIQSAIDRQRTYPDRRVLVDTIVAFYRPADGIDCNGNLIPQR